MNTKERLLKFIEEAGITIAEFERKCSLSNGYIRKLKGSVGSDKIEDIIKAYPQLNRVWLLSGEGQMLNPSVVQNNQNGDNIQGHSVTVNKTEADYIAIIKLQAEQLSKSQVQISKSQEQIDRLLTLLERR